MHGDADCFEQAWLDVLTNLQLDACVYTYKQLYFPVQVR